MENRTIAAIVAIAMLPILAGVYHFKSSNTSTTNLQKSPIKSIMEGNAWFATGNSDGP